MTAVTYTLGVLLFVVGVAVSVGLHELGHMIPGKAFGVKVTQYFVGFGRTIWSRQRGETEYGVKAVPLGGYVKLIGMLPPAPDEGSGKLRPTNTGVISQMVSDARRAESELIEPGDENRLFYRLPWWKKVIVMGSGVATNLVLAFLLFAVVFMGHGVRTPTTTVETISKCVVAVAPATQSQPTGCSSADPVSPAVKAGLRPGDTIVAFNGQRVSGWEDLRSAIQSNADGAATIVVERDGRRLTMHTNTTVSPRPDAENPQKLTRTGFLGVTPTVALERQGPGFVVTTMANGTWETLKALGAMPVKLYHVARAAIGLEQRDVNGPMSVVGAGRVAGELTSQQAVPVSDRFFSVLLLIAGLNLFLGLLNLVPLLPLDGGQIAGALYEAVRRGIARLLKRPDPGFVDVGKLLPVGYVMAGVILVASVVLIYADIVAPISLS